MVSADRYLLVLSTKLMISRRWIWEINYRSVVRHLEFFEPDIPHLHFQTLDYLLFIVNFDRQFPSLSASVFDDLGAAFEQEWKCEKLFVRSFLVKPVPCISPASVSPWVSFSCDSSSESPAGRNSAATQIQQQRKSSSDANSAAGDVATQTSSSPRNFIIQISRHKSRILMQETSPEKFRGNSHAYKPDFTL
ncbi:elongator complex protein 2 [Dorcoceras hygrometricum]|uniref:Elongator complex protein 2 n=1 Tax=Dorcoceras hygrometricum TaxID=472368 RepID=A0A2Z7CM56_9LAMI|nr:elongator complex protein 2 [Dorcoceras hygrometricum]